MKKKIQLFFSLFGLFFLLLSLNGEKVHAEEVVNVLDFGVTPNVPESQTAGFHEAMRYFHDRGISGTLYIPAGTYSIDEALRFHADVNLVGDGIGQTILKKTGNSPNYVVGNPVLHAGSNQLNATISHLTIDADRINRENQGQGLVGGINIDADVSNLYLVEMEVRNTTIGALLRRIKDSEIRDSYFDHNSGHALAFGSESHAVGDVRNNEIIGNTITNSTGGSGINLSRATYTTVRYNSIINQVQQNDTYGGIRIPNGGAHNIVEYNTVENYPRGLFILSGAHDNYVAHNTIINSRIHGALVQADSNTLVQNEFRQLDSSLDIDSVIRLAPGSHNEISNNTVLSHSGFNKIGVRVTGASNQNTIRNNQISTNGTLISIEGGSGNVNEGNTRLD
ncbi:hypothetical protein BTS2_0782 [Bacillus sp. TS-2]|nr:hypothetical protein BTS2_0782 [Bacillus sp. TS-2]